MARKNYRSISEHGKFDEESAHMSEEKQINVENNKKQVKYDHVTNKTKQKIFVSLPMKGLSIEQIRENIDKIYSKFKDNYDLIDTIWPAAPEASGNPIWYLGKSIQALGTADLVVFAPDWQKAYGCRVERMACGLYGIPFMDLLSID